jgi:hypothetical protein
MTSYDLAAFQETFDNLARVLISRRMDDGERSQTLSAYFKALRAYSIESVKGGAESLLATAKHFPKPVEWIEAMPRRSGQPADVPIMFENEARIRREAEAVFWERDPCGCSLCVAAQVDWKPLRFVPEFDDFDCERKVFDQGRNKVVTAGHWAHGAELAGYYRARGEYLSRANVMRGLGRTVAMALVPR